MYPNPSNFVRPKHVPNPLNTFNLVESHPLQGSSLFGGTVEGVFRNLANSNLLLLAIEGGPVSRVRYHETLA